LFEHSDAVTKVEKNPFDPSIFLSAGKDSQVNVWRFADSSSPLEFHYDIGKNQLKQDGFIKAGSVTAAKWYDQ
jgi:WD40 repeat protein